MTNKRYAVIDIGTLKVKLQIAEKNSTGELATIYQSNNLTCLGCHLDQNSKPKKENLQKTLKELRRCKDILKFQNIEKIRIVSTHALREMGGVGREVAGIIKNKINLNVEIISQQEEAELFYRAVMTDFKSNGDYVIADVGGGSVQILIGGKEKLKNSYLLKTGTSTLWDMFTPKHKEMDFPNRTEIRKMRDYILAQLQPIPKGIKTPIIYGSSCIIDLFHVINMPMQSHFFSKSHPYKTKVSDMSRFLRLVWSIPYETREEKFVSPTYRYMWGVDKAFLNIVELAKKVKAPYIIPSNANINQGLLMSIIE